MSSFRRDVTLFAVGAGATITAGLLVVSASRPRASDDERPPVIVSDGGSIKVYADDKGDGTGHGYFHQEKNNDKKKFYHDHPYAEPASLGVAIYNYASCTTTYNGPYETNDLTFKYGEDHADFELNVKVKWFLFKGNYLGVQAKDEDFVPDGPYTLWLKKDNDKVRLYSVAFKGKDAAGASVNQICNFTKTGGRIELQQKKQPE